MTVRALCWIDAGPEVGMGHARRAAALAEALEALGAAVALAAPDPAAIGRRVAPPRRALARARDAGEAAARAAAFHADVVVIDLPHTRPASAEAVAALRGPGRPVVAFDTSAPPGSADLVVNAVAHPDEIAPVAGVARGAALLGPRHAVIDPALARAGRRLGPVRPLARDLLIAFGGADPADLTTWALSALRGADPPASIRVAAGAAADRPALREAARRAGAELIDGTDLLAAMRAADVAICGFGMTVMEACACALPAILVHPTPEHAAVAARFARHLDAPPLSLGWHEEVPPAALAHAWRELAADPLRRTRMARSGVSCVDGRGAARVARAVAGLAVRAGLRAGGTPRALEASR